MYYNSLFSLPGKKVALLIDPDKQNVQSLITTIYAANESNVNLIFIGGSIVSDKIETSIEIIKKHTSIPVFIFPGNLMQLSKKADGILLLSLISGRNPEYLIGNHVLAASYLKNSNLEVIPTGYILIGQSNTTSVEYISNTKPIPYNKPDIIVSTAIAGELLGHKLIYLEAGSGANERVNNDIIKEVKRNISIPLIVGGGIRTEHDIVEVCKSGADLVVLGSIIEENLMQLGRMVQAIRK